MSKHPRHAPRRRTQHPQPTARGPADRRDGPRVPLRVPAALPPAAPARVGATRVRTLPLAPTYEEWVRAGRPAGPRAKPRPTRPDRPRRTDEPILERPTLGKGRAR